MTGANASDIGQRPALQREDKRALFGDAAYADKGFIPAACGTWVFCGMALKA